MPVTNTYTALVGAIPSPHSIDFLPWVDRYIYLRKRHCKGKRTTTYYIDPVNGSDSNTKTQAQSQSTPWKTLTNVRKAITGDGTTIGGSAGFSSPVNNVAFLFKRGTILRDSTGLVLGSTSSSINNTNLYFGAYGAMGGKPIISNFTILFNNGFTVSTPGGATNRRQITLTGDANITNTGSATNIGWLRAASTNNYVSPYLPFTYVSGTSISAGQDATAYALIESTNYSFYVDSNGKLNVNFGAYTASANSSSSTVCWEATPPVASSGTAPDGIKILPGSDGLWIDSLIFEGFGCTSNTYQNPSGVRNGCGTEEVIYLSNCESYYNGRHALSHESGVTTEKGGVHIAENCTVGYCSPNLGYVHLNSYAVGGGQETVYLNCNVRFGALPAISTLTDNGSNYASHANTAGSMDREQAFYGHTGYTISSGFSVGVGLYINKGCTITDERDQIPLATVAMEGFAFGDDSSGGLGGLAFMVGTKTDPTTYRVFIIDYKSPRYRKTDVPGTYFQLKAPSQMCFINCHHYWRHAYAPSSGVYYFGDNTNALWINSIFEVEEENTTANGPITMAFFSNGQSRTLYARFLNCLFSVRGGNASGYAAIMTSNNTNNSFTSSGTAGPYFGNCLFVNPDVILNGYASPGLKLCLGSDYYNGTSVPQNHSNFLRYVAIAGCVSANTTSSPYTNGFNQATGFVDLTTSDSADFPVLPSRVEPVSGSRQAAFAANAFPAAYPNLQTTSPLVGAGSADPFYDKTNIGMLPAPQYDFLRQLRPSVPSIGPFDVVNTQTMILVGGILLS